MAQYITANFAKQVAQAGYAKSCYCEHFIIVFNKVMMTLVHCAHYCIPQTRYRVNTGEMCSSTNTNTAELHEYKYKYSEK